MKTYILWSCRKTVRYEVHNFVSLIGDCKCSRDREAISLQYKVCPDAIETIADYKGSIGTNHERKSFFPRKKIFYIYMHRKIWTKDVYVVICMALLEWNEKKATIFSFKDKLIFQCTHPVIGGAVIICSHVCKFLRKNQRQNLHLWYPWISAADFCLCSGSFCSRFGSVLAPL